VRRNSEVLTTSAVDQVESCVLVVMFKFVEEGVIVKNVAVITNVVVFLLLEISIVIVVVLPRVSSQSL